MILLFMTGIVFVVVMPRMFILGMLFFVVIVALMVMVFVIMVVVVLVERECPARPGSEQRTVFRGRCNHGRRTFAADMAIEANHPVRGAHHHV